MIFILLFIFYNILSYRILPEEGLMDINMLYKIMEHISNKDINILYKDNRYILSRKNYNYDNINNLINANDFESIYDINDNIFIIVFTHKLLIIDITDLNRFDDRNTDINTTYQFDIPRLISISRITYTKCIINLLNKIIILYFDDNDPYYNNKTSKIISV